MDVVEYEEIVENFSSPTLVLAGPGAGKTYLLADRVKRLLEKNVDKGAITVLTFGLDANQHMINELTKPEGDFQIRHSDLPPKIKTMHALAFDIVKEKPRQFGLIKRNLQVLSNENVKELLYRDAALILGFSENDSLKALECKQHGDCQKNDEISRCKICGKYREIMSKCNHIDFDDQILFACEILENNPEILEQYQSCAKHLIIDEYQDINAAQFRMIGLLSRKSMNGLFVVGDNAQSIYGFRGGDPKFILRFCEDFPGAMIPPLAHSRRCHERIMTDAQRVLAKQYPEWRRVGELRYHMDPGEEPKIWQMPSNIAEAKMAAILAKDSARRGKKVLILAPKRDFFPLIARNLDQLGVTHNLPFAHLSSKTFDRIYRLDTYFKWLSNIPDNFLTRLVIEDLMNKGDAKVAGARKTSNLKTDTIKKRIAAEKEVSILWEMVNKKTSLLSAIESNPGESKTISKIGHCLAAIANGFEKNEGKSCDYLSEFAARSCIWKKPGEFIDDISSVNDLLNHSPSNIVGYAELKTMRKAKGLDAHVVIVVGLEDDIVPGNYSSEVEQARLFYVSMTRAGEELYLMHAFQRPRNISYGKELRKKKRSRFLDAIGKKSEWKNI